MRRLAISLAFVASCASNPPAPADAPKKAPPAPAASPVDDDAPPTEGPNADAKNANAFTLRMFARAANEEHGNVMLSGASIRQAFAIAYAGAKGETAKELEKTFGFTADTKAELDAEVTVANRIWVEKSMPLNPDFKEPAEGADFKSAPEDARRTINQWVASSTKDKIVDLLPEGALDRSTRAVITNAIYFKGKWVNPFPKAMTKDDAFTVDEKTKVNVPTMHVTESFRYAHVEKVQIVELRYVGRDLSMLVVMPDDAKDLAHLAERPAVDAWAGALKTARLDLSMPRFTFRWGGSVKEMLESLGVKAAFTNRADLSGIAMRPGDLYVSDAFHQTWVSLDEQGTEAAAATGTVIKLLSQQIGQPLAVKIDHPFLFFVRSKDRILFAGRVTEPKQ